MNRFFMVLGFLVGVRVRVRGEDDLVVPTPFSCDHASQLFSTAVLLLSGWFALGHEVGPLLVVVSHGSSCSP